MSDEIAIEKALLLGQVRPPDKLIQDTKQYFNVRWGKPWTTTNVNLAWSESNTAAERWGTNWRLHHFPREGEHRTIRGFPAVLAAISDPAFRKRYGIEPGEK